MLNKAFYKKLIAAIAALGLMASLCACSGSGESVTRKTLTSEELEQEAIKKNNAKVRKSIKDFIGFEIGDEYMEEAEMLMDIAKSNSRGSICILVKQGKEDELLADFQKHLGMEKNIGPNLIPAELNDQYSKDLRNMDLIKQWTLPSSVSVYMARYGSHSYIYIFA